jgi:hypothetical protein
MFQHRFSFAMAWKSKSNSKYSRSVSLYLLLISYDIGDNLRSPSVKCLPSQSPKRLLSKRSGTFSLRQIRTWQQGQLVYMPGAATPSFLTHDDDADEDYVGDSEVPESQLWLFSFSVKCDK